MDSSEEQATQSSGAEAKSGVGGFGKAKPASPEPPKPAVEVLPENVRKALHEVLKARQSGKAAIFAEIYATAKLRAESEAVKKPFLDICSMHLREEGSSAFSDTRISVLLKVHDYLLKKGYKSLADIPKDLTTFPTYSQIAPLYRFIKYERRTDLKPQWDDLHGRVFNQHPAIRPSVDQIEKEVIALFAPKRKIGGGKKNPPAVTTTIIKPEKLTDWYAEIAPKGELPVAEIKIKRLSAQVLAAAIEANWKAVKEATLLRVRVGK
jgi:hypothetical protein